MQAFLEPEGNATLPIVGFDVLVSDGPASLLVCTGSFEVIIIEPEGPLLRFRASAVNITAATLCTARELAAVAAYNYETHRGIVRIYKWSTESAFACSDASQVLTPEVLFEAEIAAPVPSSGCMHFCSSGDLLLVGTADNVLLIDTETGFSALASDNGCSIVARENASVVSISPLRLSEHNGGGRRMCCLSYLLCQDDCSLFVGHINILVLRANPKNGVVEETARSSSFSRPRYKHNLGFSPSGVTVSDAGCAIVFSSVKLSVFTVNISVSNSFSIDKSLDDQVTVTLSPSVLPTAISELVPGGKALYGATTMRTRHRMAMVNERRTNEPAKDMALPSTVELLQEEVVVLDTDVGLYLSPIAAISAACLSMIDFCEKAPDSIFYTLNSNKQDYSIASWAFSTHNKNFCAAMIKLSPSSRHYLAVFRILCATEEQKSSLPIENGFALPFVFRPKTYRLQFCPECLAQQKIEPSLQGSSTLVQNFETSLADESTRSEARQAFDSDPIIVYTLPLASPFNPENPRITFLENKVKSKVMAAKDNSPVTFGHRIKSSGYTSNIPWSEQQKIQQTRKTCNQSRRMQQKQLTLPKATTPAKMYRSKMQDETINSSIYSRTRGSASVKLNAPVACCRITEDNTALAMTSEGVLQQYSLFKGGSSYSLKDKSSLSVGSTQEPAFAVHPSGKLVLTPGAKSTAHIWRLGGSIKKPVCTLARNDAAPQSTSFCGFLWPMHDTKGYVVCTAASSLSVFHYNAPLLHDKALLRDESSISESICLGTLQLSGSVSAGACFSKLKSPYCILSHMGLDREKNSPVVSIVDISTLKCVSQMTSDECLHTRAPGRVAVPDFGYSALGRLSHNVLATSAANSKGGDVVIYDTRCAWSNPIRVLRGVSGRRSAPTISFVPKCEAICVGGDDGLLRIFDIGNGATVFEFDKMLSAVSSVGLNDRGCIVAGHNDGTLACGVF